MSLLSGQITIAAAGTAVQGPDVDIVNDVIIRAMTGNGGLVYFGNDGAGDVTALNGYELAAGESAGVTSSTVTNLNQLWFDAAANGYKFCWIIA